MGEHWPHVTVIMPIRNEGRFIVRSLGAVLAQDYPPDRLEVLVADGMSRDGTREAVGRLAAQKPRVKVTVVDNPGRIVPTGFNAALARAQGEIIVRVDGHTIVAPDYVRRCVEALAETGAENVGGRMDPVGKGWFGRAVAIATCSRFGVGGAQFHYATRQTEVDTVYLGAWPRRVFERLGGFDEEQVRNQDDEFNHRLRKHGGRVVLMPAIKSRYFNRATPRSLWRQYFQYGYWKVRVLQKHPRQMRPRQFAPAVFVTTLTGAGLGSLFLPPAAWLLAAVAGVYAIANLAVSTWLGRRQPLAVRWALPVAFATLHLAYGSGFLTGLAAFWNRWPNWSVPRPQEQSS
jgi:glycosyltransferase involved in cell wall biosynthesis